MADPGRWLVPLLVVALGFLVRLLPWSTVFTPSGIVLRADTDPHYHVLRAERLLHGSPGAPWRDPWLGWPDGAVIPWPPLFDAAVAGTARLTAAAPSREDLERAGSLLVVLLGVLTLPVVAALGARLTGDRSAGWLAAALVAVTPAIEQHSEVGRVDQHGAELLLLAAMLAVLLRGRQRGEVALHGLLLGLLVAVAAWTWLGSAFLLALLALVVAAWFLQDGQDSEALGRSLQVMSLGCLSGAVLLAVTVGLLGPPGALHQGSLLGLSALPAALALGAAGFAAALELARRRFPASRLPGRLAALGAAALAPGALLLAFLPVLGEGVRTGLTALTAGNAWYAAIGEFQPLLFSGDAPLGSELRGLLGSFGLVMPAAALGVVPVVRTWRAGERQAETAALLALLVVLTGLTVARQRFMGYAMLPLSVLAGLGLGWAASALTGRLRVPWLRPVLLVAGLLACAWPALPSLGVPWNAVPGDEVTTLRWLRAAPGPTGREGVFSSWSMGHAVQYFADKPVVASPFGTEGGPRSMERWARIWFASAQDEAERELALARVGWVVLGNPLAETHSTRGLAPPGTPPLFTTVPDAGGGAPAEATVAFYRLVVNRLYLFDGGSAVPGQGALDAFQLQYESPSTEARDGVERQFKVFARVPGARLTVTGLEPNEVLTASIALRTNQGRVVPLVISRTADAHGEVRFRLPYASGRNGDTVVEAWTLSSRDGSLAISVPPSAVESGQADSLRWSR